MAFIDRVFRIFRHFGVAIAYTVFIAAFMRRSSDYHFDMAHAVLLLTSRLYASDRAVAPRWPAHPTFNIGPLLKILELHSNSYGLYGPGFCFNSQGTPCLLSGNFGPWQTFGHSY